MKKLTDEKLAERIALLEHAEAETGQLSLHGEAELACLRELREYRSDAYLNSVRAEGVDLVKSHPAISLVSLTHICDQIAEQLRSCTDDTADKAG